MWYDSRRQLVASASWLAITLVSILSVLWVFQRSSAYALRSAVAPTQFAGYRYQFVFVGKSTCGACKDPDLPSAVARISRAVAEEAEAIAQSSSALGVATDEDPRRGLEFLAKFGRFDEFALGEGWDNMALRHFQDQAEFRQMATPAVYVSRRRLDSGRTAELSFGAESILVRLIGVDAIRQYATALDSSAAAPIAHLLQIDKDSSTSRKSGNLTVRPKTIEAGSWRP